MEVKNPCFPIHETWLRKKCKQREGGLDLQLMNKDEESLLIQVHNLSSAYPKVCCNGWYCYSCCQKAVLASSKLPSNSYVQKPDTISYCQWIPSFLLFTSATISLKMRPLKPIPFWMLCYMQVDLQRPNRGQRCEIKAQHTLDTDEEYLNNQIAIPTAVTLPSHGTFHLSKIGQEVPGSCKKKLHEPPATNFPFRFSCALIDCMHHSFSHSFHCEAPLCCKRVAIGLCHYRKLGAGDWEMGIAKLDCSSSTKERTFQPPWQWRIGDFKEEVFVLHLLR